MKSLKVICMMLVILATHFLLLDAAWLEDIEIEVVQPDGTVLHLFTSGDEFHHWVHNKDNFTIIQDSETGFWCWAKAVDGYLISTGSPVHLTTPYSMGLQPGENISGVVYGQIRDRFESLTRGITTRSPSTGEIYSVVVLIRFSDDSEFSDATIQKYDNWLHAQGKNVDSMYQYFWDASYNQLKVFSPIYPKKVNGLYVSYQDNNPRGYFQAYNAVSNPIGWQGTNDGPERRIREHTLLRDAIAHVREQVLEAGYNLDNDGDGYVDNVNFIVRGGTGAWSSLLWPHMWYLTSYNVMLGNARVYTYNFNIESRTDADGVSVLAHEFTHSLGIPDFYRGQYNGNPVRSWCLMASNSMPAQSITAHNKNRHVKWNTIRTITENERITLQPITLSQTNHAVIIPSISEKEYFIAEHRSDKTGLTDSSLPGSGLAIWRVTTERNGIILNGNINREGYIGDELYIFRPFGEPYLGPNGTSSNDGVVTNALFSSEFGRVEFHDNSNPRAFLHDGGATGVHIYDIGKSDGETISFNVCIDCEVPTAVTESFEDGLRKYDWQNDRANPWTITEGNSNHGSKKLAAPLLAANESSRFQISLNTKSGHLQFFAKTALQYDGGRLRLLINKNEVKSFSGTTDWTIFSIPLSIGINDIVWEFERGSNPNSADNQVWIDQIYFPEIIGGIPYPPTDMAAKIENNKITLNWQHPFNTTVSNPPRLLHYGLYLDDFLVDTTTDNEYIVNSAGGTSYFHVTAVYENETSLPSNKVETTTQFGAPKNLRAESNTGGVLLSWDYDYDFPETYFAAFIMERSDGKRENIWDVDARSWLDPNVIEFSEYSYKLRVSYYTTQFHSSDYSNDVTILYDVSEEDEIEPITNTNLIGNYPNPFNPITTIDFTIDKNSHVNLEIYNIKGSLVKTLVNKELTRGNHSIVWNGDDNIGNKVASGVYFYKMQTGEYQSVRKMVLLK